MSIILGRKCGRCLYFLRAKAADFYGDGECRHSPPAVMWNERAVGAHMDDIRPGWRKWPHVYEGDYCGQWEAVEDDE